MDRDKLNAAANVLSREANRAEGLMLAAQAFRDAATLVAQLEEAERALGRRNVEIADAEQKLRWLREEEAAIAEANKKARAEMVASAEVFASSMEEAREAAAKVAVAEAQRIVDAAKEQAAYVMKQAEAAKDESAALVEQRSVQVQMLQAHERALRAELEELTKRLNDAKAAAARIAGGEL